MRFPIAFLLFPLMIQASDYSAKRITVDSVEVIRLADEKYRTEVSIAPSIGNLAYEMKVNGKNAFWLPVEQIGQLRTRGGGCCNPFLWPWANRLDGDGYWANGKRYQLNRALGNVRGDQNGKPIHGLLLSYAGWEVTDVRADGTHAETTSRLEFWRHPDLMAQFPFAHSLEMIHRLHDGTLEVETVVRNLSDQPIPVALGFHPYFRLYDTPRDQWKVHLAARDAVVLSNQLIPTGERNPIAYSDPLDLKGIRMDDVFTNLVRDGDGRSEFWVQGAKERISVIYGPKFQVAVVWAPPGREFICFEPMAGLTNAFNLAHDGKYPELQSIPPGGVWRESYWIKTSGF